MSYSGRSETILSYLSDAAFNFYFERFTLDNAPTEEAKDYGIVKEVKLEKFSTQEAGSVMMREALTAEEIFLPSSFGLKWSTIKRKLAII